MPQGCNLTPYYVLFLWFGRQKGPNGEQNRKVYHYACVESVVCSNVLSYTTTLCLKRYWHNPPRPGIIRQGLIYATLSLKGLLLISLDYGALVQLRWTCSLSCPSHFKRHSFHGIKSTSIRAWRVKIRRGEGVCSMGMYSWALTITVQMMNAWEVTMLPRQNMNRIWFGTVANLLINHPCIMVWFKTTVMY